MVLSDLTNITMPTQFTGVVPGPPSKPMASKSSKGVACVAPGRKVKESASVPEPVKQKRKKGPASMDDLERMLQNDHVALLCMKKDIGEAQQEEIRKAKRELLKLQSEYDDLKLTNNKKERVLKDTNDSIAQLSELANVALDSTAAVQGEGNNIQQQLNKVNASLESEQRTLKMLTLIAKRLNDEITEARVGTAAVEFELDIKKHENVATNSTLLLSRQEVAVQEKQASDLAATVKARREERLAKMKQLKGIVSDGDTAVETVKNKSVVETEERSPEKEELAQGTVPPTAANTAMSNKRSSSNKVQRQGSGIPTNLDDMDVDDILEENPLDSPFSSFNFAAGGAGVHTSVDGGNISIVAGNEVLNFENIKQIIERYRSKQMRCSKLTAFASELDEQLALRQEQNKSLSEKLEKSLVTNEILSSNRAMYQDIEMIDKALATARKECEDCKNKEYKLRANVGSLKRGFPRFLTKLTKVMHPVPANDQLADCIHKLIDEVSKLIKNIGTLIIKDATPDDLALLTANTTQNKNEKESGSAAEQSEICKIRKLPGYQRLQRQLFVNLMSARQDVTDKNVRIYSNVHTVATEHDSNVRPDTVHSHVGGEHESHAHAHAHVHSGDGSNGHGGGGTQEGNRPGESTNKSSNDPLDRNTVKSISVMILDKNNARPSMRSSNAIRRQQYNSGH